MHSVVEAFEQEEMFLLEDITCLVVNVACDYWFCKMEKHLIQVKQKVIELKLLMLFCSVVSCLIIKIWNIFC